MSIGDSTLDPVELAAAMIRCPSVTPADAGALDVLQTALEKIGFTCRRLPFSEPGTADVDNLYARFGASAPNFCFAGHTDVVPVGDADTWRVGPFDGAVIDDTLFGRGAADMKGAIACFAAAAERFLEARGSDFAGSISLLIAGDEEGPAINGTVKMLDRLAVLGETLDACLVGEPTNPDTLGEMVKIGRRGSITGRLTVIGTQGHAAYPQHADNPIPRLLCSLSALNDAVLDDGTEHFQPSNLEITTIDVGNSANNVIPATASAVFNIRFNDKHTGAGLSTWMRETCDRHAGDHELAINISGEAFLTPPGRLSAGVCAAVEQVTGRTPELSTTGGTSDARFIKNYCPVIEFGLASRTMHQIDEQVPVADLYTLTNIYAALLNTYFATAGDQ